MIREYFMNTFIPYVSIPSHRVLFQGVPPILTPQLSPNPLPLSLSLCLQILYCPTSSFRSPSTHYFPDFYPQIRTYPIKPPCMTLLIALSYPPKPRSLTGNIPSLVPFHSLSYHALFFSHTYL